MVDIWARYIEQSAKMPPDAEVEAIVEAALSRGRRVETCLDLGCGGGRHWV